MSTTAEATYVCQVCSEPLKPCGGRYPPRWCAQHREAGGRSQARRFKAVPVEPAVYCEACRARLLEPSGSGYCGFCIEEQAQVPLGAGSICQETPKRATYAGTTDS